MTRRLAQPALPRAWGWGCLGLVGSSLVALAGPRLVGSGAIRWWYVLKFPGPSGTTVAFYVGMLALCVAWLGLGRQLRSVGSSSPRALWVIAAVWSLPLVLGPAVFSRDVYSYLAQGTIVHLGLSPYHYAPAVLGHLGHAHVLAAVAPFWRNTTAPYGPLFLGLVSVIVSISGSHLIFGVLLVRLVELIGIVLLAVFVPRLARALGADPARATWLALLNPIVLLQLVAAGHNDALMVGLLVAGVTFALERRPLLGIVLCSVAATIKVPAAAGVVFIAVVWAQSVPEARGKLRVLGGSAVVAVAVVALVSAVTGLGLGWISTTLFSTPGRVQLAITPSTALGWTIAKLLHDVGMTASTRGFESAVGTITFALSAALGLWLLLRARRETMVLYLGVLLIALAFGGPAAWPWYFTWGLVLLAACPSPQRSRAIAAAVAIAVFTVKADGTLALSLRTAPLAVIAYLLIVAACAYWWRQRRHALANAGPVGPAGSVEGVHATASSTPAGS